MFVVDQKRIRRHSSPCLPLTERMLCQLGQVDFEHWTKVAPIYIQKPSKTKALAKNPTNSNYGQAAQLAHSKKPHGDRAAEEPRTA